MVTAALLSPFSMVDAPVHAVYIPNRKNDRGRVRRWMHRAPGCCGRKRWGSLRWAPPFWAAAGAALHTTPCSGGGALPGSFWAVAGAALRTTPCSGGWGGQWAGRCLLLGGCTGAQQPVTQPDSCWGHSTFLHLQAALHLATACGDACARFSDSLTYHRHLHVAGCLRRCVPVGPCAWSP